MSGQLSQKMTMVKRWGKILAGKTEVAVRQGPGRCYVRGKIAGYYNDLTGKVSPNTLLDDSGIPLSIISGGAKVHFPIAIFQYALGCYDISLLSPEDAPSHRSSFQACARWALESQREDGSWDAFGPLGSRSYTVSSMAQGEGCSVLLRAYQTFGGEAYLNGALRAVDFMLRPFEEGGVSVYDSNALYLEEYPQVPRRSVLNGWVFSIFGLLDAALVAEEYAAPLERTLDTLETTLASYDTGYWSYYDLSGRIASPAYHTLHVAQLEVLADVTGRETFQQWADRFGRHGSSASNRRRAIMKKVIQKLTEKSDAVVVQ